MPKGSSTKYYQKLRLWLQMIKNVYEHEKQKAVEYRKTKYGKISPLHKYRVTEDFRQSTIHS